VIEHRRFVSLITPLFNVRGIVATESLPCRNHEARSILLSCSQSTEFMTTWLRARYISEPAPCCRHARPSPWWA
jgi:hypothetical protein